MMDVTVKLVVICASVVAASGALTDIRFFAPQAWIGPDGTISFADTSAITVNVAHTFFRTFGLTKPSDADIVDFCDALDLNERTELAGLHALYSEPVLIFLEDFGGNPIAFYANSGLNVISHYPETRTIFEALLGASKTVFLAYKPERFLRPHMRNSLAGRFFVPENFRFDPLIEAASAATHLKVTEAPIIFKRSDIPDLYPYVRSSISNFDIHQIQNAVMKPVPLALSEKAAFPTVFSSKPAATLTNQAVEPVSNALTANNATSEGLQSLFVRNPLACARFARAVEDSGQPATAETTSDSIKAASYLANEAADYVLKALLARNPEVGARIARQALKDYSEVNSISRTGHINSTPIPTSAHITAPTTAHTPETTSTQVPTPIYTPTCAHTTTFTTNPTPPPASTLTSIPQTIHTPSAPSSPSTPSTSTSVTTSTPTSSATSTSTSSSNNTSTALHAEPQIFMYDPISAKMYKLVSDDGTFPAFVPRNSSTPDNVSDETTKILLAEPTQPTETKSDSYSAGTMPTQQTVIPVAEPKQPKETKFDDHKTDYKGHNKHQIPAYDFLRRLSSGLPQVSHQFANVGHLLNTVNAMKN